MIIKILLTAETTPRLDTPNKSVDNSVLHEPAAHRQALTMALVRSNNDDPKIYYN